MQKRKPDKHRKALWNGKPAKAMSIVRGHRKPRISILRRAYKSRDIKVKKKTQVADREKLE